MKDLNKELGDNKMRLNRKIDMRNIVEKGYNKGDYSGYYRIDHSLNSFEKEFFDSFTSLVKSGGHILDWGSGPGIPYDLFLTNKGFKVTGIDISEKHVKLAGENVPNAQYIQGDFSNYSYTEKYDALLSLYAIFHLPRDEHRELLKIAKELLLDNGKLLINMGVNATEEIDIEDDFCGTTMAWSHYDAKTNLKMVEEAGFRILLSKNEADYGSDENHLWILAERR